LRIVAVIQSGFTYAVWQCVYILSVFLYTYGCETWSHTLREGRRLRVFENRVLRGMFGAKMDEVTGKLRKLRNEGFNYLFYSPNIVRLIKSIRMKCSTYGGRGETYTEFWWGNVRERDHLEDTGVDGRIILRRIFRKWDVGSWTGSSWLRIRTCGGHL